MTLEGKTGRKRRAAWLAFVALAIAFVGGCASGPPRIARRVDVGLSRDVPDTSVKIDFVGVDAGDLQRWQTLDLDRYWDPGGPDVAARDAARQAGRLRSITLGGAATRRREVVAFDDPVWKPWAEAGVAYLVVLTDLPFELPGPPQAGEGDSRRRIFPLNPKARNAAGERVTLRVQGDGFVTLSR